MRRTTRITCALISAVLAFGLCPSAALANDLGAASTAAQMSAQATAAAKKSAYKLKRYEASKTYGSVAFEYLYEKPVLSGKSAAVKKVNKSLNSRYKKYAKMRKEIQAAAKRAGSSTRSSWYKTTYYCSNKTTVSITKKKLTVAYEMLIYDGGARRVMDTERDVYSLKTGKKLS